MINELEQKIIDEQNRGGDTTQLRKQLLEIKTMFVEKAASLTEGTNILKG